jgi:serine/threonine-protein kinase
MPSERDNEADPADASGLDLDPSAHEADPLPPLEAGAMIEGKYRIDRVIGRGGMGVVAAATHLDLDEPVALKFLQVPDTDTPDDFRARFALEARVCAKLRNAHIARVHDVGEWMGRVPFMVMELLDGVDLRRVLKDGRRVPIDRAVDIVVQVCEGLAEAHAQGIVHRDLKPPNIFLTRRPDGSELVKVLDFGISKWAEELGELTKTGVMLGSPKYMSPEQLNGTAVDGRADVWSIGAILYGMLTGRPPYDFTNVAQTFMAIATGAPPPAPTSLDPSIPPAVESVVLRCLAHDRNARIGSVAELAGELLRAVDSPHASEVQGQLLAVLEPAMSTSMRSGPVSLRSSGPLSSTTGSYNAAFAVGNSGSYPVVSPPMPTTMPAPGPKSTNAKRWLFIGGVAAAFAIAAAFGVGAGGTAENAAAGTASRTEKIASPKRLMPDRATKLVVALAVGTEPARVQAWRPPPARSSAKQAPTSSVTAALAFDPAPSAPTPPKTAAPVNPLEDRQ